MLKKIRALFLITTLLIYTSPQAAINTQNLAGTTLLSAGSLSVVMALATGAAIGLTGGLAIGALGVALLIDNNVSSSSTSSSTVISIELNPNVPLITPQGWTPAVSPSIQPTPPNNANPTTQYFSNGSPRRDNPSQTCADIVNGSATYHYTQPNVVANTPNGFCSDDAYPSYPQIGYAITSSVSCPAGYTNNSSMCTLTNQDLVTKPVKGKMEVTRVGDNFATDPKINPSDILPSAVVSVTPKTVTVNDATGGKIVATINPDSTTSITTSKPKSDGSALTDTTTVLLDKPDTNGNSRVIGVTTAQTTGTGALSTNASPSLDVSGLNKEGTQQAIKNTLDGIKTQQCGYDDAHPCKTKINEDGVQAETEKINGKSSQGQSDIDTAYNGLTDKMKNQKDGVGAGLSSPFANDIPSSTCTNPVLDASDIKAGARAELKICEHASEVQPILSWACYMFTAAAIYSLWFRRTD